MLGSFYLSPTSGVQWPVSDSTSEASIIDPDIATGLTSKDVLSSIVKYTGANGYTNYVSPLLEARYYFKGDKVWYNEYDWPVQFAPPYWSNDRYLSTESSSI